MPINDAYVCWLEGRLSTPIIVEVWIFGSAVRLDSGFRDIDVFLKYRNGSAGEIVEIRRRLAAQFQEEFGVPLHFLTLSEDECLQSAQFLDRALMDGRKIL